VDQNEAAFRVAGGNPGWQVAGISIKHSIQASMQSSIQSSILTGGYVVTRSRPYPARRGREMFQAEACGPRARG